MVGFQTVGSLIQIARLFLDATRRTNDKRARLSIHRAVSPVTTSPTRVPYGSVSLSIDNTTPAEVRNLRGRYKASWTNDQWRTLDALPANIPGNKIGQNIPGIEIPHVYAEREAKHINRPNISFEIELTYTNPDESTFITTVKQCWPIDRERPYQWDIQQQQTTKQVVGGHARKSRLLRFVTVATLVFLAVGATHLYKSHRVRVELAKLAVSDKALLKRSLDIEESGGLMRVEYFDKAQKNIDAREKIAYDLDILDPYVYQRQVTMFSELLKEENDFIRRCVAFEAALMEAEAAHEAFTDAFRRSIRSGYPNDSYSHYIYREEYVNARERVDEAEEEVTECSKAVLKTLDSWLTKERRYSKPLSQVIGPRDIVHRLESLKREMRESFKVIEKTDKMMN